MNVITNHLMDKILSGYCLDRSGIHGVFHWARVYANGMLLADKTGADKDVVALFAVLHDSKRISDDWDGAHGARAAKFAESLNGKFFDLDDAQLEQLYTACLLHNSGATEADMTVRVCWDSDRLDLGRVGITPDPAMLCTPDARRPDILARADQNAVRNVFPENAPAELADLRT